MKKYFLGRQGFGGTLAMAVVFIMLIGFNTATLYGLFVSYTTLTEIQLPVAQDFFYCECGVLKGVWLIKTGKAPTPYSGSYTDNNFVVNGLDGPVTIRLEIQCVTPGTGYNDSKYEITAKCGLKELTLELDKLSRSRLDY